MQASYYVWGQNANSVMAQPPSAVVAPPVTTGLTALQPMNLHFDVRSLMECFAFLLFAYIFVFLYYWIIAQG